MTAFWGATCDDFYVSHRLFLKLDLAPDRETILHFFDQVRKEFPHMQRLRQRDDKAIMLEEDALDNSSRRWIRIESSALRFGYFAPARMEDVVHMTEFILEQAPFHLTFSPIDYDHFELVYGFDLEYSGNHDQIIAETLYRDHPLASLMQGDEVHHVIDAQPYFGVALTPQCDLQAYLEVKSRTSTYEIRTHSYEPQPLSVFLTIRKYWGYSGEQTLLAAFKQMMDCADELTASRVVPLVVNPLAQAIASEP